MIKLYFRTVKILAKKMPTYISVVAAVLLIMKTFMVKYYDRRIQTNTASIIIIITERGVGWGGGTYHAHSWCQ